MSVLVVGCRCRIVIERSVADIVADLRRFAGWIQGRAGSLEAADLLERLDARAKRLDTELDRTNERWLDLRVELERLDALRITCPTCYGIRYGVCGDDNRAPCPDCTDGRMSWERMAAIATEIERLYAEGNAVAGLNHLRSVRP